MIHALLNFMAASISGGLGILAATICGTAAVKAWRCVYPVQTRDSAPYTITAFLWGIAATILLSFAVFMIGT
jgi:hypothetical protein